MTRATLLVLLLPVIGIGCGAETTVGANSTAPVTDADSPAPASRFEPLSTGKLAGFVTWVGEMPQTEPVTEIRPRATGGYDIFTHTHPYTPQVDRFSRGVAGAVVSIRGIDASKAKPWDMPPVSVTIRDSQIAVTQGDRTGRIGFIRKGETVRFQSAEPAYQLLRGRGAAFFSLPFPTPNSPLERTFDTYGRISLSNASGSFWQAADIFVCDHPYHAVTNSEGRFEFTQVPIGKYELVAWHPTPVNAKVERNPESGLPFSLHYAPAHEVPRPVMVVSGHVVVANLTLPK